MAARGERSTGDPEVDAAIDQVVHAVGARGNRDLVMECLVTIAKLAAEDHDRLDLKITNAALGEMRRAFGVFKPYRDHLKVTMFGSARTQPDDPAYDQARALAARLAAAGWMVVTGAGPGIMAAGMEGAGTELSIGVNIRLPHEQGANSFIAQDPKLVEMKYFFTRKLMLIKESDGYVVLPGGFGTLDETYELLTLLQTGKAQPAPVVLLDVPGGSYFRAWERFVQEEILPRGLIGEVDLSLYKVTDSVDEAVDEVLGFYRSYRSLRYVGDRLVLRLATQPTPDELAALSRDFADVCIAGKGGFEAVAPSRAEVAERDALDLHRIALPFDRIGLGRLRQLIDVLNTLPSAAAGSPPTHESPVEAGILDPASAGDGGVITDG